MENGNNILDRIDSICVIRDNRDGRVLWVDVRLSNGHTFIVQGNDAKEWVLLAEIMAIDTPGYDEDYMDRWLM